MAQDHVRQNDAFVVSTDNWDGYPANRTRLLKRIQETQVSNPVVFSGDMHSFFANNLRVDFDDPNSPVVATEFVGTSISATGRRTHSWRRRFGNDRVAGFEYGPLHYPKDGSIV